MPTLYVRDVPKELHERIKERAKQSHRSVSAEITILLGKALEAETRRTRSLEALDRLRESRRSYVVTGKEIDSLTLLREDRDR